MGLQIWHFADIENILWAIQTVLQASLATPAGDTQPAIHSTVFQQNFVATLRRINASIGRSPEIWSRQMLEDVLLAVQLADTLEGRSGDNTQLINHAVESARQSTATALGVNLFALRRVSTHPNSAFVLPDPLFGNDIRTILLALESVIQNLTTASVQLAEFAAYTQGFETALNGIARLFGLRIVGATERPAGENQSLFWGRPEIQKRLFTLYQTISMSNTGVETTRALAYRQGFRAAIECVGLSFNLKLA